MSSGIYCIKHLPSGDTYIGSAHNLDARERGHKHDLIGNRHFNKAMQLQFTPFREEDFGFRVLERCPLEDLHFWEKWWIGFKKPTLNVAMVKGRRHGELKTPISFRLDEAMVKAMEEEREAMGVLTFSLSDAVRELVVRTLKERGRL